MADAERLDELRERIDQLRAERDALLADDERDWPYAVELAELEAEVVALLGL